MSVAVRAVLVLVLGGVVVIGLRERSRYTLLERVGDYRAALSSRALGPERGVDSVPSEEAIEERAIALAAEFDLEPSEVEASVDRDAAPVGAARLAADRMGEVGGRRDVDVDGNLVTAPPTQLRATVLELTVRVHAEGFLVTHDEVVTVRRNAGFAMR